MSNSARTDVRSTISLGPAGGITGSRHQKASR
jgi:hypothetical protein